MHWNTPDLYLEATEIATSPYWQFPFSKNGLQLEYETHDLLQTKTSGGGGLSLCTLTQNNSAYNSRTYFVKTLSKQTLQTREYLHLIAVYQQFLSTATPFFDQPPARFPYKPLHSKMTYLWEQMHQHTINLQSSLFWLSTSKYDNDVAIMDTIIDKQEEYRGTLSFLNAQMVQNTNTVWLHLKANVPSPAISKATRLIRCMIICM